MSRALLVIDVQNEYFTGAPPITHPVGHLERILEVMDAAAHRPSRRGLEAKDQTRSAFVTAPARRGRPSECRPMGAPTVAQLVRPLHFEDLP